MVPNFSNHGSIDPYMYFLQTFTYNPNPTPKTWMTRALNNPKPLVLKNVTVAGPDQKPLMLKNVNDEGPKQPQTPYFKKCDWRRPQTTQNPPYVKKGDWRGPPNNTLKTWLMWTPNNPKPLTLKNVTDAGPNPKPLMLKNDAGPKQTKIHYVAKKWLTQVSNNPKCLRQDMQTKKRLNSGIAQITQPQRRTTKTTTTTTTTTMPRTNIWSDARRAAN